MPIVSLLDRGERRNDCKNRHRFMHCATDYKARRRRQRSRQEMQIAVVATSLPIEFPPIQFVSADDRQIRPQGAQRACNNFFPGEHARHAEKTDKQARDAKEHSDDGAGSHYDVTGRLGAGVFRKFVDQRILRTPVCSAKRLLVFPGEAGRIVYC